MILPDGAILLLDLTAKHEPENVWRKLSDGRLQTFHWETETGNIRVIPSSEWLRHVRATDETGQVVSLHPVELIKRNDLSWLFSIGGHGPGRLVGDDPILVEADDAARLFPDQDAATDTNAPRKSSGRPRIRDDLAARYRERFPNGHDAEGLSWPKALAEIGAAKNQKNALLRGLGLKE